jgi:hypothetical protein
MRVALVRIIRDWLESGNGGADAVASLLPLVPRESGDAAPSAPAFDDETQDGFVTRMKGTVDGVTYPCVAVWCDGPLARDAATAMPQEEVRGRVIVAYVARDPESARAGRLGDYVLRACQRSLHRLNRETAAATTARTRGETTLVAITASEVRGGEAMTDDVWITGALALDVLLRDTKPEG